MKIKQKVAVFLSSETTKNSATLLSAGVMVQVIALLIYPIIARVYSPEDFGLVSLFLSITGILSLFATAEFQYSIVLPKSESKAIACFCFGGFITLVVVALLVCTIPFSEQIANIFNAPNLSEWYWAVPVFVFLSGIWTLLNYWYTRHKQFRSVGRYQMTQSVTNAVSKCAFGYAGMLSGGLILSAIISPFIALCVSIARTFKGDLHSLLSVRKEDCKLVAKEYKNFPKYSLPRALVNSVSRGLPILLLTPYFGLSEIGYFGMALTLGFSPITMISNSLYQVFYQKTAEQVQRRESVRSFLCKFIKTTLSFIVPGFALLYIILPDFTELLLGEGWHVSGEYIRIMLVWIGLTAIASPLSYIPDVFQKQKIGLAFEVILVSVRVIGLAIGIWAQNFTMAIMCYSIGSAIVIFTQLLWFWSMVTEYEKGIQE